MTEVIQITKPPFPWFGGKSRVADIVSQRFGDMPNYVEPFFGSGAVLFRRPHPPGTETVNDLDCYVANFWRATKHDPDAVADAADWPVNEADLNARHKWLLNQAEFRERMRTDPDYYDAKIAGWWVWGQCQWIAGGWCDSRCYDGESRPSQQLPHLSNVGQGIHRPSQIIHKYIASISARLRRVRVCCGDWSRVCGPTPTVHRGLTGMFLDPPYGESRADGCYATDSTEVHKAVHDWALEHGADKMLRIALCGYEGEFDPPSGWETVEWKAHGGYGNRGNGQARVNAGRERIWFSPLCLRPTSQAMLF